MARERGKLTAFEVERKKQPGTYNDGGGLYLQVTSPSARSWLFRYRSPGHLSRNGKPLTREMGLGSLSVVSLHEAREEGAKCRQALRNGVDPLEMKRANRERAHLAAAKSLTFREAAQAYHAAHRASWRSALHAEQWSTSLDQHVMPTLGHLSVAAIDTTLLMKVIEPLWVCKTESASRIRARIERILEWAKVRGYRSGENPARWKGHLDMLLAKPGALKKANGSRNYSALPYAQIAEFMVELRRHDTVAARALEFTILCAARSGEVRNGKWPEIDEHARVWTIPPEKMKGGRVHRVPLSARALAVLKHMRSVRQNEYIFPGRSRENLPPMAMYKALRGMGRHVTTHGFRATFKTWASECTTFQRETVEAALAHVSGDKLEAAYNRGDQLQKRARLMAAWADYCGRLPQKHADVVQLHA
jgi:integrase